jgi:23S rRNA U2552 (ribose-2'-O)-methylase RlmE/FtsJ
MLILEGAVASLETLSPFVRQNISTTMELTRRVLNATSAQIGPALWTFVAENEFDCFKHVLRVECFPKEETEAICLALQKAAAGDASDEVKPFDGVVSMTPSASKCTHILHILLDGDVYWVGLVKSKSVVTKLNDNAAKQVIIEPTDPATGEDLSPVTNPKAPVSRAYYKLDQAWNEVLAPIFACTSRATRGAAVDLGAAPGGWTQVLSDQFPLVVAVDQGVLAKRVAALDGVKQLVAELSSEAVAETLKAAAPLSVLVCDASTDSNEILDKIIALVKRLGRGYWTLPCAWVVTLKLPYKTSGSLERNLAKVMETIPRHLEDAADLAFAKRVSIKFKVAHLMANSDSERTIMAVFDDIHPK